jgi:glycerol-3-phosphate dehydrogenase
MNYEMVCKPLDFIERRTGRLYFMIKSLYKFTPEILEYFREKFSWSEEDLQREDEELEKTYLNAHHFE